MSRMVENRAILTPKETYHLTERLNYEHFRPLWEDAGGGLASPAEWQRIVDLADKIPESGQSSETLTPADASALGPLQAEIQKLVLREQLKLAHAVSEPSTVRELQQSLELAWQKSGSPKLRARSEEQLARLPSETLCIDVHKALGALLAEPIQEQKAESASIDSDAAIDNDIHAVTNAAQRQGLDNQGQDQNQDRALHKQVVVAAIPTPVTLQEHAVEAAKEVTQAAPELTTPVTEPAKIHDEAQHTKPFPLSDLPEVRIISSRQVVGIIDPIEAVRLTRERRISEAREREALEAKQGADAQVNGPESARPPGITDNRAALSGAQLLASVLSVPPACPDKQPAADDGQSGVPGTPEFSSDVPTKTVPKIPAPAAMLPTPPVLPLAPLASSPVAPGIVAAPTQAGMLAASTQGTLPPAATLPQVTFVASPNSITTQTESTPIKTTSSTALAQGGSASANRDIQRYPLAQSPVSTDSAATGLVRTPGTNVPAWPPSAAPDPVATAKSAPLVVAKPAKATLAQIPWSQAMQSILDTEINGLDKTFALRLGAYAGVAHRRTTAAEATRPTREALGRVMAADAKARYQALRPEFELNWRRLLTLHAAEIASDDQPNSAVLQPRHVRQTQFLHRLQEAAMPRLPNPLELGELASSRQDRLPRWLAQPNISPSSVKSDPASAVGKIAITSVWLAINTQGVGKNGLLLSQLNALRPYLSGRPLVAMARIAARDKSEIAFPSATDLARCKSEAATRAIANLFSSLTNGPSIGVRPPSAKIPEK